MALAVRFKARRLAAAAMCTIGVLADGHLLDEGINEDRIKEALLLPLRHRS